jgi:hypothetical protein
MGMVMFPRNGANTVIISAMEPHLNDSSFHSRLATPKDWGIIV